MIQKKSFFIILTALTINSTHLYSINLWEFIRGKSQDATPASSHAADISDSPMNNSHTKKHDDNASADSAAAGKQNTHSNDSDSLNTARLIVDNTVDRAFGNHMTFEEKNKCKHSINTFIEKAYSKNHFSNLNVDQIIAQKLPECVEEFSFTKAQEILYEPGVARRISLDMRAQSAISLQKGNYNLRPYINEKLGEAINNTYQSSAADAATQEFSYKCRTCNTIINDNKDYCAACIKQHKKPRYNQ